MNKQSTRPRAHNQGAGRRAVEIVKYVDGRRLQGLLKVPFEDVELVIPRREFAHSTKLRSGLVQQRSSLLCKLVSRDQTPFQRLLQLKQSGSEIAYGNVGSGSDSIPPRSR